MPMQDLSLTARWAADMYTVTVFPGTGVTVTAPFTHIFTYYASGFSQTKTIIPLTCAGYKITGWVLTGYTGASPSISVNGSIVTIPANTRGDFTITPTWSKA